MSLSSGKALLKKSWFGLLWTFIAAVSFFDGYLVAQFRDVIQEVEQNPVGYYLLNLEEGNVWMFLRTKAAGTLLVLSVLVALYRYRRGWAFPVTGSLACFQCCLLLYLTSGTPTRMENVYHAGRSWTYPFTAETSLVHLRDARTVFNNHTPL